MMSPVVQALWIGLPVTAVALVCVYFQKRSWRTPAKTARGAELKAAAQMVVPMSQLGIRISPDRFVYANTGRILGPLDGATATLTPAVPVHGLKPSTGFVAITFPDGTVWEHRYALRNQALAKSQLARFQAYAAATPPGQFRRTRPGWV